MAEKIHPILGHRRYHDHWKVRISGVFRTRYQGFRFNCWLRLLLLYGSGFIQRNGQAFRWQWRKDGFRHTEMIGRIDWSVEKQRRGKGRDSHHARTPTLEETIHAFFMKRHHEKGGLNCQMIKGVANLRLGRRGWCGRWPNGSKFAGLKTWACGNRVKIQIRADVIDAKKQRLRINSDDTPRSTAPRLGGFVLLRKTVMVYEPTLDHLLSEQ